MLHNNLDPEVAERPDRSRRLRGHRQGGAKLGLLRRHRPRASRARGRRDAARAVGQGRREASNASRRAASPHRELEPRPEVGHLGRVPPPRGGGPDDVRADDGGLVDLHRYAGDPAGHVRDVRRGAAGVRAARTRSKGPLWVLTAGLGGMGGAQPLAATMAGMSCLAVEVDASRIEKRLASRYVDERIDDLDAALARLDAAAREGRPVEHRRFAGTPPRSSPSSCAARSCPTS